MIKLVAQNSNEGFAEEISVAVVIHYISKTRH